MSYLSYRNALTGWFMADALNGVGSAVVPQWFDASGQLNHLTTNAGTSPTYTIPNQTIGYAGYPVNGHPYMTMVSSYFMSSNAASNFVGGNTLGVFVVCKIDSISFNAASFNNQALFSVATSTDSGITLQLRDAGSAPVLEARSFSSSSGVVSVQASIPALGEWGIAWMTHGALNLVVGWNDEAASNTTTATGISTPLTNPIVIGANSRLTRFIDGQIAEVMIFNRALLTTERAQVMNYLRAKYFSPNANTSASYFTREPSIRADALEQSRDVASRRLWYQRRPMVFLSARVPMKYLDQDILDDVMVASPIGLDPSSAGAGWGNTMIRRRHMRLYESNLDMDAMTLDLGLMDMRNISHTYQESALGIRASTQQRQGVMVSSRGTVRAYGRPSFSWIEDPSSGAIVSKNGEQEKVAAGGLLLENAASNYMLRSSFVSTSSGLTPNAVGGASAATTTTTPAGMLFSAGVTQYALKVIGANPVSATPFMVAWPATWSLLVNAPAARNFMLNVDHCESATSYTMAYTLQRANDSRYWSSTLRTWSSSSAAIYNSVTNSGLVTIARYSESISVSSASGTTNLTFSIGMNSTTVTSPTAYVYHAELIGMFDASTASTVNGEDQFFATSRIVTDTTRVSRWGDNLTLYDASAGTYGVLPRYIGTFRFNYAPLYSAGSVQYSEGSTAIGTLVQGRIVLLFISGTYSATTSADGAYFALYYDDSTNTLNFRGQNSANSGIASIAWNPVAGQQYAITCRYIETTSFGVEVGTTGPTLSIFVDGVKGTDSVWVGGGLTAQTVRRLSWSNVTSGVASASQWGHIKTPCGLLQSIEGIPYWLTDEEVAAW
jgi:hypothetical protein